MKKPKPVVRNDNMMLIDKEKRPDDVSISLYEANRPISLTGGTFDAPNFYKVKSVSQPQKKKKDNDEDKIEDWMWNQALSPDERPENR